MNILAAVSILLVTILAFQTTVINGAKSLAEHKHHSSSKEHLAIETPPRASSNSGVLSRVGRGAKSSPNQGSESGVGKRGKNNKKLNKSTHLENPNASATSAQSTSSDLNSPDRVQQTPQQQGPKHQQGAGAASSGAQQHNGKPKQKQLLKSQQHQSHVKRGGGSGNKAVGDKKPDEQKQSSCRYSKSAWTECDAKTNSRSRTLTLKRGESNCLQTRTIQKKCKKACRYEKGGWTECTAGQMTRQDKLKTTSDPTCEAVRSINKKCNPGGKPKDKGNKERKNKDKGSRKAAAA